MNLFLLKKLKYLISSKLNQSILSLILISKNLYFFKFLDELNDFNEFNKFEII